MNDGPDQQSKAEKRLQTPVANTPQCHPYKGMPSVKAHHQGS